MAEAPTGTYFTRGALVARGTEAGGYRPRLLLGAPGRRAAHLIGSPHRHFKSFDWRARVAAGRYGFLRQSQVPREVLLRAT